MSPQTIAVLVALQAIANAYGVDLAQKRPADEGEPDKQGGVKQREKPLCKVHNGRRHLALVTALGQSGDDEMKALSIIYSVSCILGGLLSINWLLQLWPMPVFPIWACLMSAYVSGTVRRHVSKDTT